MYLNIPKITHRHGKGWDVVIDIQEVDPEAADCGSHLRPKASLVISHHCQLHAHTKIRRFSFHACKTDPLKQIKFLGQTKYA